MSAISTTPVAPTIVQSASLLDGDDADSEPPQQQPPQQQPPLATLTPFQANSRQVPIRSGGNQSQQQISTDGIAAKSNPSFPAAPPPPPAAPSSSPTPASIVQSLSTLSLSSPSRPYPTSEVEVHDTIPEEDDETDYDTPNEPVTPVSGRQSRDGFHSHEPEPEPASLPKSSSAGTVAVPQHLPLPAHSAAQKLQSKTHSHHGSKTHDLRHPHHQRSLSSTSENGDSTSPLDRLVETTTPDLAPPADAATPRPESPSARPDTAVSGSFLIHHQTRGNPNSEGVAHPAGADTDVSGAPAVTSSAGTDTLQSPPPPLRRQSRGNGSTTSFKRTMSSFFRRSNSQHERAVFGSPDYSNTASDPGLLEMAEAGHDQVKSPVRRWSMHRSLATTQSNSPPSPGSPPLEMTGGAKYAASSGAAGGADASEPRSSNSTSIARSQRTAMPTQEDFFQNESKKHRQRASTSMSFHNAIHIVTGATNPLGGRKHKNKPKPNDYRRRASSFDHGTPNPPLEVGGELWALPAEAGTGLKARRMSLSLPDDFTVDVADLHTEFDYQHMLGRHRRHLGKGATSKVTLMFRKGFPEELYAVKEFRGKSSSETREEYEKKVKSEYSIAKSLHHPNIVETVRLCADHGRWNHVMEYCQEGDLYNLVERKYLTAPEREKDRLCLFKQLVQGLHYLHSHGIAHRDIKLENLLITNHSKLKITDFGASDVFSGIHPGLREAGGQCGRQIDNTVRLCRPGICGSLPYISPEVLEAKAPYDPRKLDVWAAAIVMIHLVFGAPLWAEARGSPSGQQATTQYDLLVRSWDKYNRLHLPGKQEAEKQHAEKLAAASRGEANNEDSDAESSAQPGFSAPSVSPDNSSAAQPAVAAVSQKDTPNPKVAASPAKAGGPRPTVDAAPITDGNPNSLVEGPYPAVLAFDTCVNPPVLRRIILQMLNPDPKRRVTIDQVANLRWIRSIECCQQESYEDPVAPSTAAVNAPRPIDASKRSTTNPGQKIYCHDHMPSKAVSLVRMV